MYGLLALAVTAGVIFLLWQWYKALITAVAVVFYPESTHERRSSRPYLTIGATTVVLIGLVAAYANWSFSWIHHPELPLLISLLVTGVWVILSAAFLVCCIGFARA